MINTLYLPELREMLAENNVEQLRDFCTALHPARTAEFMEGLRDEEAFEVLSYAEPNIRTEVFSYFSLEKQVSLIQSQERASVAELIANLAPDDRVDLLEEVDDKIVDEILHLLPVEERRDIIRLRSYPDDSAGAIMTTEVAKLDEKLTVREALDELGRQSEQLETIYYLYVVDQTDHLRGIVSARQLVSKLSKPDMQLKDLMESDLATVNVLDDQEEVALKVAHYDLLAIPVVDSKQRLMGIITHDDVIDVVREEATEDAHRIAGVDPLQQSYIKTGILTLSYKRGIWLTILFCAALLTAYAMGHYEESLAQTTWLKWFIPLVISTGGNSGSQSSTLVITAMAMNEVRLRDWLLIIRRELQMGFLLGFTLALIGFVAAYFFVGNGSLVDASVIPITVLLVVVSGTFLGATLPLLFLRLGLDPALMSSPFVAGIIDILGIVIYMNVAMLLL
ncbi:MAG: magnesium transporter [Pirellulaceae bacterium]|jgi:magnesium transporter